MNSTGFLPSQIAQADQFQASARTFARYTAAVMQELIDAGFPRPEALLIVTTWLRTQK